MVSKGYMIRVKRVLGIIIGVFAISSLIGIGYITDVFDRYNTFFYIVLLATSLLLVRSGSRL